MSNERLANVVDEREVDGACLRECPTFVRFDMVESVWQESKVRSLLVRHYCVIRYKLLNKANVIYTKINIYRKNLR